MFVKCYKSGLNDRETAKKIGVHHLTVARWRKAKGLQPNDHRKLTTKEISTILTMNKQGKSDYNIAKEINRCPATVCQWRKHNGIPTNNPHLTTKELSKNVPDDAKPWHDPESLYCDTEFLDSIMGKPVRRIENAN